MQNVEKNQLWNIRLKSDVPSMGNGDRPAVMVALTCSLGRFELPGFNSLGEDLVRHDGGGAVAVWAPSGLSLNHLSLELGEAFFGALYQDGEAVLGDAILRSGESFGEEGRWLGSLYNLIGDPALQLKSGTEKVRPHRGPKASGLSERARRGKSAKGRTQLSVEDQTGSSSAEKDLVSVSLGERIFWQVEGLEMGMYLWRTDTPEAVDVRINGTVAQAIVLSDGVACYVGSAPSELEVLETADPHRMDLRDAWPRDAGEVIIVIADPSGASEVRVEQSDERILLLGLSESPLVVDVSDPKQPVEVQAVLVDNKRGHYALYMSPGVSHLLVVERAALRILE